MAVLSTSVYLAGLISATRRRLLGMGADSLAVLLLYMVGIAGLFAIDQAGGKRIRYRRTAAGGVRSAVRQAALGWS